MSKGLAYTPFALIAATIIVSMAFTSINNVETDPLDFTAVDSVAESWERTQGRYAVDSLDTISRELEGSITEQELHAAATDLTETGVYGSVQEKNSTYVNWSSSAHRQFSTIQNISLSNMETSVNNLSVKTESTLQVKSLKGSKKFDIQHSIPITGVQDPLLDNTTYNRDIYACSFEKPGEKLFDGSSSSGTVRGPVVVQPDDPSSVNSPSSKILVVSDVTEHSQSNVQSFLGYFSAQEPVSPGNYNDNYVVGTSGMPGIETGESVIIHSGLWRSNFETAIQTGCYMSSSLDETPSFTERLNEEATGNGDEGIYSFVSPSSSETDVAYERVSGQNFTLVGIETVSETGEWPDFRMSEQLAESNGLSELIK